MLAVENRVRGWLDGRDVLEAILIKGSDDRGKWSSLCEMAERIAEQQGNPGCWSSTGSFVCVEALEFYLNDLRKESRDFLWGFDTKLRALNEKIRSSRRDASNGCDRPNNYHMILLIRFNFHWESTSPTDLVSLAIDRLNSALQYQVRLRWKHDSVYPIVILRECDIKLGLLSWALAIGKVFGSSQHDTTGGVLIYYPGGDDDSARVGNPIASRNLRQFVNIYRGHYYAALNSGMKITKELGQGLMARAIAETPSITLQNFKHLYGFGLKGIPRAGSWTSTSPLPALDSHGKEREGLDRLWGKTRESVARLIRELNAADSSSALTTLLLAGPGKSLTVDVLSQVLNRPYVILSSADLGQKLVGQAEKRMHELARNVVKNPQMLVVFEDIEKQTGDEGTSSPNSRVGKAVRDMVTYVCGNYEGDVAPLIIFKTRTVHHAFYLKNPHLFDVQWILPSLNLDRDRDVEAFKGFCRFHLVGRVRGGEMETTITQCLMNDEYRTPRSVISTLTSLLMRNATPCTKD